MEIAMMSKGLDNAGGLQNLRNGLCSPLPGQVIC